MGGAQTHKTFIFVLSGGGASIWNELKGLKKRFLFACLTNYKHGLLRRKNIYFQFVTFAIQNMR